MARARLQFLSEDDKQSIHEQTLRVLAAGVAYNAPQAVDLLAEAGARVDRERLTACLDDDLVEAALRITPARVLLAARDPARDVVVGGGHPLSVCSDGTATYLLDDASGERLPGTAQRLRQVMRLLDALPECDYVWPSLSAATSTLPRPTWKIELISLTECAKHLQDEVRGPEFVEPLVDILEAVAGAPLKQRPIFSSINCTVAPLQHDAAMTQASLALARHGVPIIVMPMPLMGTTAPASPIGTCIVSMAEILVYRGAAPARRSRLRPYRRPRAGGRRHAHRPVHACGAPEATVASIASLKMCRFYGLPNQLGGLGGDARYPDLQEGSEGALSAALAALAGADSLVGFGTLDGAQSSSLADAVLDNDAMAAVRRLLGEYPSTPRPRSSRTFSRWGPVGIFSAGARPAPCCPPAGCGSPACFVAGARRATQGRSCARRRARRGASADPRAAAAGR